MTRLAWLITSLVVACGGDAAEPDAAPADATDLDARPDAPPDAPIDAAPPSRCAETAERVHDPAPRRISSVVAFGDRIYFEVHNVDAEGNPAGGAVLELDPVTLATTPIRFHSRAGRVTSAAYGWLYAISNREVWRYQPGQPIEVLASERAFASSAISDGTYVYWAQDSSMGMRAIRRPLAGGDEEPLIDGLGIVGAMDVDDTFLYISENAVGRLPKGGGGWQTYIGDGPNVGIADDGPFLYRASGLGVLDRVEVAGTAVTELARHDIADAHAHFGMALSTTHFYVTSSIGIERAPRTGGVHELVWSGFSTYQPTFLGDVLYWTDTQQLFRCTTI